MACKESGNSKILLCLGLYLVASSFCHCTRLIKLKALDKPRGNSMLSHGQAKGSELHHGRLLIGQNSLQGATVKGTKATKNLLDVDMDYQADMGWGESRQSKGQSDGLSRLKPDNVAVEQLLKMEPKVECTGDSMKLQVHDAASTPGSLFFVDRGSGLSPLPLSKLPLSCGYTIRSMLRDLVLVAPYDGCFVALEEDSYVLPLLWLGLAVRMSCPLMRQSSPNPPMVTCHTEGMVVKTEWTVSVTKIKVNLTGDWEPLMKASPRCGFSVIVHPEGVVISVRYEPCLSPKDGMYTLELTGDGETKISCPSLSTAQLQPTKGPAKGPQQQTETPSKGVYPSFPSYNSASTHAPEPSLKNPAQSTVSQVPGFPQIPEVSNKKPNQGPKDIYQPQSPYFPFYPHFFYHNPANPNLKPTATVQEASPPRKNQQSQQDVPPEKPLLNPEGQVPQPLIPLPFYPWPDQPKEPSVQPPTIQQHYGQEKQPFYPYPFYVKPPSTDIFPSSHRPELKPFSSTPLLVVKTINQRLQAFYPFLIYHQPNKPETFPTESLATTPPPGKSEIFRPNPFNPWPVQKPVEQSESQPEGQEHKPLHSLPFYPWSAVSEAPQVEPSHPVYPEDPQKSACEHPVPQKHPVSEEPERQIYLPFYPYPSISPPFFPQGPYEPVLLTPPIPTSAPKATPQPEAPQGPFQMYPQPEPGKWPGAHPAHPATETPIRQVHKPSYPGPFMIPGAGTNDDDTEKPVQPPAIRPPEDQVPHPFNPYYYPQHVTLPPATTIQQQEVTTPASAQTPNESAIPQPSNDVVPQSASYIPPVHCPQFCPSGFSNCCLQISFHQHVHHIYPAGSKDGLPTNPGLPFFPLAASSGFGNGFGSAPLHQKPTEATTTQAYTSSTSAPTSPQSHPSENEKQPYLQPPDGNPAALPGSNPSTPTNPEQLIYPYFVSNSLYPNWPYPPQNQLLQSSSDFKGPKHPKGPSEPDRPLVPYYMLQDAEAPTYNKLVFPNNSKPQKFASGSKKSTRLEEAVGTYPESKSYVLLQHGPPGRELHRFNESPLPFRHVGHDANFLAQNLEQHQRSKPQHLQNLKSLQEKTQHPKWLGKGLSNPLSGNINYIVRTSDKSKGLPLLLSAPDGPHYVPLPHGHSPSAAHLNPKFLQSPRDMWKP